MIAIRFEMVAEVTDCPACGKHGFMVQVIDGSIMSTTVWNGFTLNAVPLWLDEKDGGK